MITFLAALAALVVSVICLVLRVIIWMERQSRPPVRRRTNRRVMTEQEYWRERHGTAEVTPARTPPGRGDEGTPSE